MAEAQAVRVAIPVDPSFREALRVQRGNVDKRVYLWGFAAGAVVGFGLGLGFANTSGMVGGIAGAVICGPLAALAQYRLTTTRVRDLSAQTWLRVRGSGYTHLLDSGKVVMFTLRVKGADGTDHGFLATGLPEIERQPVVVDYTRYGRDVLNVANVGGARIFRREGYTPPPDSAERPDVP
jgi:hypothetical protein